MKCCESVGGADEVLTVTLIRDVAWRVNKGHRVRQLALQWLSHVKRVAIKVPSGLRGFR